MISKDLVVIGGGAAGLAAAISAYENGVSDILLLDGDDHLGGILNQCIHNGFGLTKFKEELTGPEYANRYIIKLKKYGIEFKLNSQVVNLSKEKIIKYTNSIDGVVEVKAKAIIVATGSYERSPGAVALPGSRVSGIMTAGMAQKFLNINGYMVGKKVIILGSGDIGLIMARRLTLEGAKVICVAEVMPYSNGLNRNIVQCLNDFNIPLKLSTTVSRVEGKKRVERVVLVKVDENKNPIEGTEEIYNVDSLVCSVGLIPYVTLLDNLGLSIGGGRGAVVDENLQTEIPGLFSCGNCLHIHDLVDYVSLEGETAGKASALFIKDSLTREENIQVEPGNLVSYVVPNYICSKESSYQIKFRVRKPIGKCKLVITSDNKIIKTLSFPSLVPSIMQNITVEGDIISGSHFLKVGIQYE